MWVALWGQVCSVVHLGVAILMDFFFKFFCFKIYSYLIKRIFPMRKGTISYNSSVAEGPVPINVVWDPVHVKVVFFA